MDRTSLLAVGVTLFVLGIVLRGFAREQRRTLARRKQHELETKQAGERSAAALPHFEKHFANYANGVFVLGMIVAVVALIL